MEGKKRIREVKHAQRCRQGGGKKPKGSCIRRNGGFKELKWNEEPNTTSQDVLLYENNQWLGVRKQNRLYIVSTNHVISIYLTNSASLSRYKTNSFNKECHNVVFVLFAVTFNVVKCPQIRLAHVSACILAALSSCYTDNLRNLYQKGGEMQRGQEEKYR